MRVYTAPGAQDTQRWAALFIDTITFGIPHQAAFTRPITQGLTRGEGALIQGFQKFQKLTRNKERQLKRLRLAKL